MPQSESLPTRLRKDTADLHAAAEEAAALPHSVRTRGDYCALLTALLRFHVSAEQSLGDGIWGSRWALLGIDLARHRRSALLVDDLTAMGASVPCVEPVTFGVSTFPSALGCLYVVEGSALGGRVIAPAIRRQLGAVPTSFFDSAGRDHPSPWRDLRAALQRYSESGLDHDDVVDGARATFVAFQTHLAARQEVRPSSTCQ
jgi:heme oxygenase